MLCATFHLCSKVNWSIQRVGLHFTVCNSHLLEIGLPVDLVSPHFGSFCCNDVRRNCSINSPSDIHFELGVVRFLSKSPAVQGQILLPSSSLQRILAYCITQFANVGHWKGNHWLLTHNINITVYAVLCVRRHRHPPKSRLFKPWQEVRNKYVCSYSDFLG